MRKKPSKQSRSEEKRNEILDAATIGFRDEGYETISMDRIAELASASKRTVYNHFGSKETLFRAVIIRHLETLHAKIAITWDADQSLEEQLERFGLAKAEMAADPSWLAVFQTVFSVMMRNSELAKNVRDRAMAGDDALVTWIEAAHQAKCLNAPDAQLAADQFWALVKGSLFWPQAVAMGEAPSKDKRDKLIREAVITFLARYRRT